MTPADPIAVALLVARELDTLGILYTTGGSIASSIAGEPRSTVDVDLVAALGEEHVPALVSALSREFYVDEHALRVAGGTVLDEQQLQRRQKVDLGGGRALHVHPPEDILLQKLRWYRRGGEVSDRQWRDVLAIIRIQGSRLDRDYLSVNAPALDVADLLARALEEGG